MAPQWCSVPLREGWTAESHGKQRPIKPVLLRSDTMETLQKAARTRFVPGRPNSWRWSKLLPYLAAALFASAGCTWHPDRTGVVTTLVLGSELPAVNAVDQTTGTLGDARHHNDRTQMDPLESNGSQAAGDSPQQTISTAKSTLMSLGSRQARSKQNKHQQTSSKNLSSYQKRSMQEEKAALPLRSYAYGNIHQTAYYFADVVVGTPAVQRQSLILDTGSSVLAFPCTSCKSCGRHMDPPFDCSSSSTCKSVPCSSTCTHSAPAYNNRSLISLQLNSPPLCAYRVSYMEGSSLQGFWHEDQTNFGCHVQETELFVDQKASGIWGLEIWSQFGPETYMTPTSFALCLAEHGGAFSIGDANGELHTSDTVLLDSGTTMSYFPTRIYDEIVSAIEDVDDEVAYELLPPSASPRQSQAVKVESTAGELCFYLPKGRADLSYFPDIWLHFKAGSGWVRWQPASYLYTKGNEHYRCVAMSDDPRADSSGVLGSSFFIGHDLIFDVRHEMIGIAEASCPGIKLKDRPKDLPM
uniref:Aspartic protease 7 n=1 Tax=Toxoplasma gondii TaxID=5811 RepID=A0MQA5_TOXGO|nr:aspartic protease 7 [Toxoplasma gondii]